MASLSPPALGASQAHDPHLIDRVGADVDVEPDLALEENERVLDELRMVRAEIDHGVQTLRVREEILEFGTFLDLNSQGEREERQAVLNIQVVTGEHQCLNCWLRNPLRL